MTSYTQYLLDKNLDFPAFALLCARAFGALCSMRDDDMGATVPDELAVPDYYAESLAEAKAELSELLGLDAQGRIDYGEQRMNARRASLEEELRKSLDKRRKLEAMRADVRDWRPPTPEHAAHKKFMLEQLELSFQRFGLGVTGVGQT